MARRIIFRIRVMNAEKLVTSLEVSKKLKDAGWESETWFGWASFNDRWYVCGQDSHQFETYGYQLPAPTMGEVWEALPVTIEDEGTQHLMQATVELDGERASMLYYGKYRDIRVAGVIHPNPVEAAALLWLDLKEQGLLEE